MEFALPELGEGLYEAEMIRWLVKPGDSVKRGQSLLEVMTDKATMEVPAPFVGTIQSLTAEPGTKLKVGQTILIYQGEGARVDAPATVTKRPSTGAGPVPVVVSVQSNGGAVVAAAPSVRHMARKLGIDLTDIRGTGPAGRILVDDLATHIPRPSNGPPRVPETPRMDYGRAGDRIKMQGVRRKIAEHLVDAKRRIPHYSYVDECDVTEMVCLRHSLREPCAKMGVKLTYLAFFVKAVTAALKEIPIVNSSLDDQKEEIVLHDYYHIGIAVAAPSGLVVPVVKDADRKDLFAIAREVERLAAEAKAGRAKHDDLKGSTFTVTSVGNIGGLISTPIINHPEVAILGIGKVIRRPVYDDRGELRPADLLYLSFSFDHRVVDGAIGAAFGNIVKKQLENPAAMLVSAVH